MKFEKYLTENDSYKTEKDKTGHVHDVMLDANGDGKTVSTEGNNDPDHEHIVKQWIVQPARKHVHNLDI